MGVWRLHEEAGAAGAGLRGFIVDKVVQLHGIDGSASLAANESHCLHRIHAVLDERDGHHDRSPPETRNTVDGNTGFIGVGFDVVVVECAVDERPPASDDICGRTRSVVKEHFLRSVMLIK